jgi:hypothetical protein
MRGVAGHLLFFFNKGRVLGKVNTHINGEFDPNCECIVFSEKENNK